MSFLKKKKKVYVIDDLSRKGTKELKKRIGLEKKYKFFKINIKDFNKIDIFFKKYNFKNIFLLAGQTAVTTSLIDPRLDFNSNVLGCFNILEALRKNKRKSKLIFSSTNKVYGKLENVELKKDQNSIYNFKKYPRGIKETVPVDFVTPYGCSKGAADFYCQDYFKTYKIPTTIMRQSCIYGRMQLGVEDQGWVAWMIIASLLKKKITIYGDGLQVRDILYADDLVEAYIKASNTKKTSGKVYNIGGGFKNKISVIGLIKLLEKKLKIKIKYEFSKERKGDQKIFVSDNRLAYEDFQWQPKTEFNRGLDNTISWIKQNLDFIKSVSNI